MKKLIMILILVLIPKIGNTSETIVCIEENEDSLPVFWAQLRENIKQSPSVSLENWYFDRGFENNPCEFWMLPVTYEEAYIIYYFTSQFDGFFSTPLIYHYNWQAR